MTTENSVQNTLPVSENTSGSVNSLPNITGELTLDDWRRMLTKFAVGLESGEISPVAANAFANLMGKGLSSYKIQMEYARALGRTPQIRALMPPSSTANPDNNHRP